MAIGQLSFVRQSLQHDYFRVMLCGKNNGVQPTEIKIDEIAVKQNTGALEFVKDQTEEICKMAVEINGSALYYVKDKTEDIL